jgi:single-strand DNA-binding protein
MSDLNNVNIIGRLTKDPELKYIQTGTSICNFSIANNYKYKDKETVSYFDCVAFGKLGELISKYMGKGSKAALTGRLTQEKWEAQDGTKRSAIKFIVNECQFLDTKQKVKEEEKEIDASAESTDRGELDSNPFNDSEIPF